MTLLPQIGATSLGRSRRDSKLSAAYGVSETLQSS